MKIQFCSDLHLEFEDNARFVSYHPIQKIGDVLILAGDIVPLAHIELANEFFNTVSSQFEQVFWIPGNHEFYRADVAPFASSYHQMIRDNVQLIHNKSLEWKGCRFLFSTLWSHVSPLYEKAIFKGMADFRLINYEGNKFTIEQYNLLHENSISFLQEELKKTCDLKTVVVTHHIPTYLHYPEKYKGDKLSEGFATEYFDFIHDHGPDAWIFGHHHYNVTEFTIGKTRMLTNQLGYVKYSECKNFDGGKWLDL
jgi:3',5'-cyclic AMP phosphodiesterase CpdA